MFTHDEIWRAIDALAEQKGFSASGLARQAGLDPTAFNRSKRTSPNGKPRWPSTESLAKILAVTESSMSDFLHLLGHEGGSARRSIPLLSYTAVRGGRVKTDKATATFATIITKSDTAFAITIDDEHMKPLFRAGCTLIADLDEKPGKHDRVLIYSKKDGLKAGILNAAPKRTVSILLPDEDFRESTYSDSDIEWIARILWASQ